MARGVALCFALLTVLAGASFAQEVPPLQIEDMFRFKRISDPQISPDGQWVAYAQTAVDLDANSSNSDLWAIPPSGGQPRQLTSTPQREGHPRFSPDGQQLLFESSRDGASQLYVMDVAEGATRKLTDVSTGASGGVWSPDGKWIAFISTVAPEFSSLPFAESNAKNHELAEATESNPVKARVFDKLFFRHWDSWVEGRRVHLFVVPSEGGEPRDVTPGDWDAYPTSMTFSVGDDFTFSPDSRYVVFTAPPRENEAWSTNHDIWRVPVTGGELENLTADNPAADSAPRYSPDGKFLAYRAQGTAGFEAAQWELVVASCDSSGKPTGDLLTVTDALDSSADDFIWSPHSNSLYFTADVEGRHPILQVMSTEGGRKPEELVTHGSNGSLSISQGDVLVHTQSGLNSPSEVFVFSSPIGSDEGNHKLTRANDSILVDRNMEQPESVNVSGAGGTPMQMWLIKPPGFDPQKKWPLIYMVHGGPQGAWGDGWSYRWNPQLWAAQGYVVACPNPRGSTGFGQQYTNEITGDWGGKVYEDLMGGMDWLESQPYIDTDRMAAAGASYGGYMMNWFQGHTDRFQTFVTHCGVYNFDSMYATEELWFVEWENGGTPWGENRAAMYEKFSPHRYAANFKTPNLIIHNDLDFRVPLSEGLQLFTTLQRKGIPSKLINFPDEGHWVNKPANSRYWHEQIFAWLKDYAPPGGIQAQGNRNPRANSRGESEDEVVTRFYLVRHAEKVDESRDPDLSPAGMERAKALAEKLADTEIAAIYTTMYKRTRQTAAPLAEALDMKPGEFSPPRPGDAGQAWAADLTSKHAGKNVLIVAHSGPARSPGTVPYLASLLAGGQQLGDLGDEYHHVYVVTLKTVDGTPQPAVIEMDEYGKLPDEGAMAPFEHPTAVNSNR